MSAVSRCHFFNCLQPSSNRRLAWLLYWWSFAILFCPEVTTADCSKRSALNLGTCKASRFDSNSNRPPDSIRFESDGPIRKFSNRIENRLYNCYVVCFHKQLLFANSYRVLLPVSAFKIGKDRVFMFLWFFSFFVLLAEFHIGLQTQHTTLVT